MSIYNLRPASILDRLPPPGSRPNMRTREGKRLKPLLIEAAGYLRSQGHTVKAIAEALGIADFTASMYANEAMYLGLYRPPETRVPHNPDLAKREYARIYGKEQQERVPRVEAARREFKVARKQGKPPPWHVTPERTDRTPEEQAELDALKVEQDRQARLANRAVGEWPKGSRSLYTGRRDVLFLDATVDDESSMTWHERIAC